VSGKRSRRDAARRGRDLRKEPLIEQMPGLGLVAMNGPGDPEPSLVVADGRVVELDGRPEAEFDALDRFIADHGIDLSAAADADALSNAEIARRLVDVDRPRDELVRLSAGLTPARLVRYVVPKQMAITVRRKSSGEQVRATDSSTFGMSRRATTSTRAMRTPAFARAVKTPWGDPPTFESMGTRRTITTIARSWKMSRPSAT